MNGLVSQSRVSARAIDCSQVTDWSREVGWDIEYHQVGKGTFEAWFDTCTCEQFRLTNESCNRETVIFGSPPHDMVAVVIPTSNGPLGVYEGTTLRPSDVIVLRAGEHRYLRSPAGFQACTMSIPWTSLTGAVWHVARRELTSILPESQCLTLSPKRVQRWAAMICSLTNLETGQLGHTVTAELEDLLLHELASELCETQRDAEHLTRTSDRARYVVRARDYIEAHLTQTIRLSEVAAHAGVSIRTLELAFHNVFGVAPMEYVRTRRLKQVREHILHSGSEVSTLTHVALEFGLVHFGRFSGDYKALFGELPSETLRQSRR